MVHIGENMQNFNENTSINWSTSGDSSANTNDWSYGHIVDYYYNWYPIYHPTIVYEKSKVDIAFKILKALQDKGVINVTKVKTFIELVDIIQKEL